jgi:hypothetical protein
MKNDCFKSDYNKIRVRSISTPFLADMSQGSELAKLRVSSINGFGSDFQALRIDRRKKGRFQFRRLFLWIMWRPASLTVTDLLFVVRQHSGHIRPDQRQAKLYRN